MLINKYKTKMYAESMHEFDRYLARRRAAGHTILCHEFINEYCGCFTGEWRMHVYCEEPKKGRHYIVVICPQCYEEAEGDICIPRK